MPIKRAYSKAYPHQGDISAIPAAELPRAFRDWYSACRGIKRQGRLNLFQAQFGRAVYRFGYLGFANGLSRPQELPIQALCAHLDHPEPATLGRGYRHKRIQELRATRLRRKEG